VAYGGYADQQKSQRLGLGVGGLSGAKQEPTMVYLQQELHLVLTTMTFKQFRLLAQIH